MRSGKKKLAIRCQRSASCPNRTSDLVIAQYTSDTPYHWAKEAWFFPVGRSGYWSWELFVNIYTYTYLHEAVAKNKGNTLYLEQLNQF
jgi:hypothetical protein